MYTSEYQFPVHELQTLVVHATYDVPLRPPVKGIYVPKYAASLKFPLTAEFMVAVAILCTLGQLKVRLSALISQEEA